MHQCTNAKMHQYINAPMYLYTNTSMHQCTNVPISSMVVGDIPLCAMVLGCCLKIEVQYIKKTLLRHDNKP